MPNAVVMIEKPPRIKSGIYLIRHTPSNRCYIGSAGNIRARWAEHKRLLAKKIHHSRLLQRYWDKYGEACFDFSVLEYVSDKSILIQREQVWLDQVKPYNGGFNTYIFATTALGTRASEEARERMRVAQTGRKHSPETKLKMRMSRIGHVITPDGRARIAAARKGTKASLEARRKMSASRTGRVPTEETRRKISASLKGARHSQSRIEAIRKALAGRTLTPEHRKSIRKAWFASTKSKAHLARLNVRLAIERTLASSVHSTSSSSSASAAQLTL